MRGVMINIFQYKLNSKNKKLEARFNQAKVLEVIKMKMAMESQREGELRVATECFL